MAYEAFARSEAERLQELRLVAVEERIDAQLALGHHDPLVAELEALVARHPLLRPMALTMLVAGFFGNFFASLYTLYVLDELGLSPLYLGIIISAGGIGSLAASFLVGPITRRFGIGPTIVWTRGRSSATRMWVNAVATSLRSRV